jgi:peptidyl-prolyl cis-trans isomerase A (cyclophilin A)
MYLLKTLSLLLLFNLAFACDKKNLYPDNSYPEVLITTSMGDILVELDRIRSPITVNNFLQYIDSGSYIGTIFHRVDKNFVVQGGGYNKKLEDIKECDKIYNESGNGLKNTLGTIAMARYDNPHSATSQFYFNLTDTPSLDPNSKNWGYTVFGEVIEGMDVLKAISHVKTGYSKILDSDTVPIEPILIKEISVQ